MAGFHVGDVWEPESTVTNPASAEPEKPVEPGTIAFTFESPRGVQTTGSNKKVAEGKWKSSQKLTEAGGWKVSVITTGSFEASQPAEIQVKEKWEP